MHLPPSWSLRYKRNETHEPAYNTSTLAELLHTNVHSWRNNAPGLVKYGSTPEKGSPFIPTSKLF